MEHNTLLIIDSSENSADLYYKTSFFVHDPIIFIEHKGVRMLVLSDLELDRGKKEAKVDMVLSFSEYRNKLPSKKRKKASLTDIVDLIFREKKIIKAIVPGKFPIQYADELRKFRYDISYRKKEPFFEERRKKTPQEIEFIRKSLRNGARAMDLAIRMIASAEIRRNKLFLDGRVLSSERIKKEINIELSKLDCTASNTIVSCGIHSSMPHHTGEGPIFAGQPVIIDIFPRSQETGYFGDMTRTVVKGNASKELEIMYRTVLKGQKLGIRLIKDGVKAEEVHEAIVNFFRKSGFDTSSVNGKKQGYIHSTGHGLGLEIHEPPRIGPGDEVLKTGNVITVEPGLYYEKLGGIRIEDVVVVNKDGCVNLTKYPKKFRV